MFSATLDRGIDKLVRKFLNNPVTHEVETNSEDEAQMTHYFFNVSQASRFDVLQDLCAAPGRSLVFTRTKHGARKLTEALIKAGVPSVELHGDLSQNVRARNLAAFSSGKADTLVATDIAARGIHVDDIALVIHADPPEEHKAFLHRSGRTARAGAEGTVITMVTENMRRHVKRLAKDAGIDPISKNVAKGDAILEEIAPGVREFREMPSIEERRGGGGGRNGGGGRSGGRSYGGGRSGGKSYGGGRGSRDDRGPREDRGSRDDRGPREDRPREDRAPRGDRDFRDRAPREDRGPRDGRTPCRQRVHPCSRPAAAGALSVVGGRWGRPRGWAPSACDSTRRGVQGLVDPLQLGQLRVRVTDRAPPKSRCEAVRNDRTCGHRRRQSPCSTARPYMGQQLRRLDVGRRADAAPRRVCSKSTDGLLRRRVVPRHGDVDPIRQHHTDRAAG